MDQTKHLSCHLLNAFVTKVCCGVDASGYNSSAPLANSKPLKVVLVSF